MQRPDLTVFDRIKTKADFDRENEAFQLEKLAKASQDPAAVKLANEIGAARRSGDTQRLNDLLIAAKSWDKGVVADQYGNPMELQGYGDAVGGIAGTKKRYEADAQNVSDLNYDPMIAGAEEEARNDAKQISELEKKAGQAQSTGTLTDDARKILRGFPDEQGKPTKGLPTGSYGGAAWNLGKRVFGVSDETTQANADLDVIAGNITGNVPRFEGPQSDADRAYYESMAGRLADKTLPREDRIAAADAIDRINAKYENIQTPMSDLLNNSPPPLDPRNIPIDAVKFLRKNPNTAQKFDQKYGDGAARMILGKK